MEVASSSNDDVGLVLVLDRFGRGLDVQIYLFLCGKEVPPPNPLPYREERSYRLMRARVVLVEDTLLPGLVLGLLPERQPLL